MKYSIQALKGISWIASLRGITRAVSFLKNVILARLLTPTQFGIFGIAILFLAFLEVLVETGVNVILIQEKDEIDPYISSAWIVSIIRGCIITLAIIFSAPFIASFFKSEASLSLILLISIVPFVRGFINPSVVKFQKELLFHKEFFYRVSIFTIDATTGLVAVYITKNPIGVIVGLITGALYEVLLSFLIIRPRPTFAFNSVYLKKILSLGKWVTVSTIFNYLFYNLDNIVVGRMLGPTSLGLYQNAYALSFLPISEVSDVFSKVTFPIFSRIADDKKRLREAYLKTTGMIALLTIPCGAILFFMPELIVTIAFGQNWLPMVPVLRILAIFGVLRAISGFSSVLFLSIGKQKYVALSTGINILGLAIPIVYLIQLYGVIGAGISALIGVLIAVPVVLFLIWRVLR